MMTEEFGPMSFQLGRLESRAGARAATFGLGAIPVLEGRSQPENPVLDRFQRDWRDALGRLFPAESAEEILSRSI